MTFDELIERGKRLAGIGIGSPDVWARSEIDLAACVMLATQELGVEVMNNDRTRPLLQQDYSVTLDGSGVGDPLTATGSITGAAGEILQEGIKYGVVKDADSNLLQPIEHYADFLRPQPTVYAYYCLKDRKIATRAINTAVNGPLDIVSVTGPLTVTANFAPASVDDIPGELEDELVRKLVTIVTQKVEAAQN